MKLIVVVVVERGGLFGQLNAFFFAGFSGLLFVGGGQCLGTPNTDSNALTHIVNGHYYSSAMLVAKDTAAHSAVVPPSKDTEFLTAFGTDLGRSIRHPVPFINEHGGVGVVG